MAVDGSRFIVLWIIKINLYLFLWSEQTALLMVSAPNKTHHPAIVTPSPWIVFTYSLRPCHTRKSGQNRICHDILHSKEGCYQLLSESSLKPGMGRMLSLEDTTQCQWYVSFQKKFVCMLLPRTTQNGAHWEQISGRQPGKVLLLQNRTQTGASNPVKHLTPFKKRNQSIE